MTGVTVTSASRKAERLIEAPATVIVLNQDDFRQRGYRELSEMFDDLPGMDISRPYGDTWFQNQWRGLRKSISVPYLLLLDGLPLNPLYCNQAEIISALPMSPIQQIEVVYGPAAVVYGANAFVGDTAEDMLQLGLIWTPNGQHAVTLRGRHIGAHDTVRSDPAGTVPSYSVADLIWLWRDISASGISLSLSALNLFDKAYDHSGVREAAAGCTPGFRDSNDVWQGSASFYNSLLPQQGRSVQLTMYLDW
ncbi:MAG: TonB-dependent receptor plug domain-containing protein [Pseudomonadota bacterium]